MGRLHFQKVVELLVHLDPEVFAVSSNWFGISIYPRKWGPKKTNFEQGLIKAGLKIPAAWTGFLARTTPPLFPSKGNKYDSSWNSSISSRALMSWLKEEEEDSSKKAGTTKRVSRSSGPNQTEMESIKDY